VPSTIALQVNGYWQASDMGRENFGVNGKGSISTPISHWSNAKIIDSVQNLLFQFSNLSIWIRLTYLPQ
jgi:hypothetical protein